MKILALVTDAFGGYDGIAQYNRDLITALAASSDVAELHVLPRLTPDSPGELPLERFSTVMNREGIPLGRNF